MWRCLSTGASALIWARPVPEGDRSVCCRSPIVTVSFPGRACHPLSNLNREGMAMTIVETRLITGGVDTHLDVHVAAALDSERRGARRRVVPDDDGGFAELHAGCLRSARSIGSVWRAPAPMGPASPLLAGDGGDGDRGRAAEPSGPTGPWQVRQHRCRGGGTSGTVGSCHGGGQDRRWQRRGDPGAARRLSLRA